MTERINRLYISIRTLLKEEQGQALTEYALVLAVIVVGAVATLAAIGTDVSGWLTDIKNGIEAAVPGGGS